VGDLAAQPARGARMVVERVGPLGPLRQGSDLERAVDGL
jgi:hypothetical protein